MPSMPLQDSPKYLGQLTVHIYPYNHPVSWHIYYKNASDSNIGEEYRNRKGIFSMNVQGVCNADLLFMNVVARWPRSAHDATIFNNSIIKMQCEEGIIENRWLISDSTYPCNSYLLTPLLNPVSLAEIRYNESHIKPPGTL
ncbi:hypothetical protein PYW08_006063 [Mythimna loreyi]|uniref:Uncharacterized protein n=1 Tax=Mythimna loreyi TaxID=667449 RepID=A0ACC2QLK6_9NEOP|nr:hypothetical protein PYW08_006063 [Mythimna loreyi]